MSLNCAPNQKLSDDVNLDRCLFRLVADVVAHDDDDAVLAQVVLLDFDFDSIPIQSHDQVFEILDYWDKQFALKANDRVDGTKKLKQVMSPLKSIDVSSCSCFYCQIVFVFREIDRFNFSLIVQFPLGSREYESSIES